MKNDPARNSVLDDGLTIAIERTCEELTLIDELLPLDGMDILELGCGRAEKTRAIASTGTDRRLLGLEVDEIQHKLNLEIDDLPNVRFELAGAENIPAQDASFDVVFLFKSLHHVPIESMDRALCEVARVLRPGGHAYISEPLFRGDFNEVLRIFHDEEKVRRKAFEAVERAVQSADFELISETYFRSPLRFGGFDEFESLVIGATHSQHVLADEVRERVRSSFARFETKDGARFEQPIRVDLLCRMA